MSRSRTAKGRRMARRAPHAGPNSGTTDFHRVDTGTSLSNGEGSVRVEVHQGLLLHLLEVRSRAESQSVFNRCRSVVHAVPASAVVFCGRLRFLALRSSSQNQFTRTRRVTRTRRADPARLSVALAAYSHGSVSSPCASRHAWESIARCAPRTVGRASSDVVQRSSHRR